MSNQTFKPFRDKFGISLEVGDLVLVDDEMAVVVLNKGYIRLSFINPFRIVSFSQINYSSIRLLCHLYSYSVGSAVARRLYDEFETEVEVIRDDI